MEYTYKKTTATTKKKPQVGNKGVFEGKEWLD